MVRFLQGFWAETYFFEHCIILLHFRFFALFYCRFNLGTFYFAMNAFAKAKYQFAEAHKVYQAFLGADHPDTKEAKAALDDVSAFL